MNIQFAALIPILVLSACSTTTTKGKLELQPGMTTQQVEAMLGQPEERSFRKPNEAWQYHDIVGFGQCEYLTVWFTDLKVHAVSARRGGGIGGCGLHSRPVDWNNMP